MEPVDPEEIISYILITIFCSFILGFISLILSIPISEMDNYEIAPLNSPDAVKFELVEASSQKLRGEGNFEGRGSFLGWSQTGDMSMGTGQGRLAVKTTLEGNKHYFDIHITRSEFLSLYNKSSDNITLDVIYEPCEVEEIQKEVVCYRLMDNGRYVSTSQEFKAWETKYKVDIDEKGKPWVYDSGDNKKYNGYFGPKTSRQLILEAASRTSAE